MTGAARPERSTRADAAAVARWAVLGAAAGGTAGLLVGGVGGRLAMLVLRLTSPDWVRGLESDDGFTIGEVSFDTAFLLAFATMLGAAAGVAYVAARTFLPERARVPGWTAAGAVVGGAAIVHGDGVDFTVLEPAWLAVAMFVAIPAVGAGAAAAWVERWSATWWWRRPWRTAVASVPAAVAFLFVPLAAAVVVVGALLVTAARVPTLRRLPAARHAKAVGGALLVGVVAAGVVALVDDLRDVLG